MWGYGGLAYPHFRLAHIVPRWTAEGEYPSFNHWLMSVWGWTSWDDLELL
jgi:hypothetical protein